MVDINCNGFYARTVFSHLLGISPAIIKMGYYTTMFQISRKLNCVSVVLLATVLTACGGGVGEPAAPVDSNVNVGTGGGATLIVPASAKLPWQFDTSLVMILRNAKGEILTNISCQAVKPAALMVDSDCSGAVGLQLGSQEITVTSGTISATVTVQVTPQRHWAGTRGVTSSSGSGDYNLVVTPSGNGLTWGANPSGVLGQNKSGTQLTFSTLPIAVMNASGAPSLDTIYMASAGDSAVLALSEEGKVWGWGDNSAWELTAQNPQFSLLPVRVRNSANSADLERVVQTAIGDNNALALLDDGSVLSWGYYSGQTIGASARYPGSVMRADGALLTGIVGISAGWNYSLALAADGRVWAWGYNSEGRTGTGAVTPPIALATTVKLVDGRDLTNIVAISAGYNFGMALTRNGEVYAWGDNLSGQLGQGSKLSQMIPYAVQVKSEGGAPLSDITMVAAGGRHALAMTSSGKVLSWGLNNDGQLGRGPNIAQGTGSRDLPTQVVGEAALGQLEGVVSIAAGYNHSLALKSNGGVLVWGTGFRGNTGQGGTVENPFYQPTPILVKNMEGTGPLVLTPLTAYPNLLQRFR